MYRRPRAAAAELDVQFHASSRLLRVDGARYPWCTANVQLRVQLHTGCRTLPTHVTSVTHGDRHVGVPVVQVTTYKHATRAVEMASGVDYDDGDNHPSSGFNTSSSNAPNSSADHWPHRKQLMETWLLLEFCNR